MSKSLRTSLTNRPVLALVSVLLTSVAAYGQPVYQIATQYPVHPLTDQLSMIADSAASFTPDQVLTDSSLTFSSRSTFPRFLDPNITYWGKVTLQASDSLVGWTLHFEDKKFGIPAWGLSNGKVDVYAYADGRRLFHRKTGADYPKRERDVSEKWMVNRINVGDLPVHQPVTLVVRVASNSLGYPPFFQLSLRDPAHQHYHPLFEFNTSFNIFMLGVTFIIFLYHLLQFAYLRQRIFFWFSVWLLFCMLTQAMAVGLILGDLTFLRFPIWMVIASGMFYTFWYFGRSFINSKEKFPVLDKAILGLSVLMFAEITATVLYIILFDVQPVILKVGIHYKMVVMYALISLVLSVTLTLKKDPFARYFGCGAIIISLAFAVGGLWVEGLIVPPVDPFAWGMFLQIIIYSFGIAYRQQRLTQLAHEEKLAAERSVAEMQRIQEIDEIKTRFFANISHEFRTPLSLIAGPLAEAEKKSISANSPEDPIPLSSKHYYIIRKNAKRLQTLVDQLLDLSQIESGKIRLTLMQGNVVKFLRSIVYSFESMAERKNIGLHVSIPEKIHAYYDRDKLEKIVTNVLSNAFKYTPDGGTVSVTVEHDDHYLLLEIADTGKGIEQEDVKRIFERFYRAESSEERGSGIGLALTKELVDLHRGHIAVNSLPGKGTTFRIRLPITLQALPPSISVGMDEDPREFTQASTSRSERTGANAIETPSEVLERELSLVLVVEDNKDLRDFISDILKPTYKVITASNGLQGERMAFEHIPDVVITDVMMPKKDGYELCHSLKENTKTSHIPIVMLTAKAGKDSKMEGLTQGADAYLTKPFDAEELRVRVKNLIEARKRIWEHFKGLDMLLVDDLDISSVDDQFLQKVMATVKENLDNEHFSVDDIARSVGFSRSQLHRKLKALINTSPNQLVVETRLNEARRLLENKAGSVSEIAYSVGYTNMSYFTKTFKEKFGLLPSKI